MQTNSLPEDLTGNQYFPTVGTINLLIPDDQFRPGFFYDCYLCAEQLHTIYIYIQMKQLEFGTS